MPRSILRIVIWNFNGVFEPHVHAQTESQPLYICFITQFMRALYFVGS